MENLISLGDCFELLEKIPDGTIDVVVTDPPYGITQNSWDVGIPLDRFWQCIRRVTKPNAAVVIFGQDRFTARMIMSNEAEYRYTLIWEKDKPTGFLNAKRMPLRYHEDIMVFYRKLPTYNPQMWVGAANHSRGRNYIDKATTSNYGRFNQQDESAGRTEKYPRSILSFNRANPTQHPTEKPVELLEWLIRTYSDPSDVVLDPFIGVGSTAVAAVKCGRRVIGMELDPTHYEIADERLRRAQSERRVFEKAFIMPD